MSVTHVSPGLRQLVRERAGECCEYCLIPEGVTWAAHTVDHIIAEKHGGTTTAENLALACTLWNEQTWCLQLLMGSIFVRYGLAHLSSSGLRWY